MANNDTVLAERLNSIIVDIVAERVRQDLLVKTGKFAWNCSKIWVPNSEKLAVLNEETGEVSKEVVEQIIERDKYIKESLHYPNHRKLSHLRDLKSELIQVAAVCLAWIEALNEEMTILQAEIANGRD